MIQKRLNEIQARKAELANAVNEADEARMTEIEAEVAALEKEELELRRKLDVTSRLKVTEPGVKATVEAEERAAQFMKDKKIRIKVTDTIHALQKRATLVSSGTLATPTQVGGIADINDGESSIIDMVFVDDCEGMGTDRQAYVSAGMTAGTQTEGNAAPSSDPTYDYVDITPTSIAVYSQISKQAKKQSPLKYEEKTKTLALQALRKKATDGVIVPKLKASQLVDEIVAPLDANHKGKLAADTLRKLVLSYGGDEFSGGQGVLFLNKTDLIAFGDLRGTNEKKAVFEIIPDANPNTGIIKDGGMSVKYCICSGLTACEGTLYSSTGKQRTMFYGYPKNFKLDLFSDYEVRVSEDFAITSLMDTIVGDVEAGGDVTVKKGFVALTIPKNE